MKLLGRLDAALPDLESRHPRQEAAVDDGSVGGGDEALLVPARVVEDPGPPQVDSWMGQSVGHWEGDTFVVEANGFTGQAWLDRSGNHASYQLQVTERYTMTSPYHMLYEATMEDSSTFSRPWTIRLPLYKHIEDNARIGVFKCVEFVEELLYGQYRKTGP